MQKFKGSGTLSINLNGDSTRIGYSPVNHGEEEIHTHLWNQINNYFKRRGFKVTADPRILKDYRCLTKTHRYGIKKDLEFKTNVYPNGFEFEFFQNIVTKNSSGGEYDFNKFKMMPYMIGLSYKNEVLRLEKFVERLKFPTL